MCTGFQCGCNGNRVSICIGCRKAVKVGRYNRAPRPGHKDVSHLGATCPSCGGELKTMSKRFRPPRRHQIKRWQNLSPKGYTQKELEELEHKQKYQQFDARALQYKARKERLQSTPI